MFHPKVRFFSEPWSETYPSPECGTFAKHGGEYVELAILARRLRVLRQGVGRHYSKASKALQKAIRRGRVNKETSTF
jgi:hypothetical protein